MSDIKMLHLYSCDLDAPTREVTLPTPLMHQDAYADVFRIHVTRGGLDLQLDGMTVRAWLYLAATGETMLLEGSADGSMAMVTLLPECYLFPGYATLAIQLQQGEECRTLIKIDLAIKRTCTDTIIDPSNVLPTLPELLAQIAAMEQGTAAANAAAEAANTAAANAQEFIVTVTTPIIAGEAATADKTFEEIKAAITAGKTPVVRLKMQGKIEVDTLHLYKSGAMSIVFRQQVKHTADYNIVSALQCIFTTAGVSVDSVNFRSVPDGGTDGQVLVKTGDSTYGWQDSGKLAAVTTLTEGMGMADSSVWRYMEDTLDSFSEILTQNLFRKDTAVLNASVDDSSGKQTEVDAAKYPNNWRSAKIFVDSTRKYHSNSVYNCTVYQYTDDGEYIGKVYHNSTAYLTLDSACGYVVLVGWIDSQPIDSFVFCRSDVDAVNNASVEYGSIRRIPDVRKRIDIRMTDGEEAILLKLMDAIEISNCDVHWERGTYYFTTIFDLLKTKYGRSNAFEFPVGGGCRYYFNGATVMGENLSTDQTVLENSSLFGTWRTPQSYELHDGTFITKGLIYCVHEEGSALPTPYVVKYSNMRMIHRTGADDSYDPYKLRKCIGGGTGLYPSTEVANCYFDTDFGADISWHGHSGSAETTFYLNVHGCYFSHYLSMDSMGEKETCELRYHGNSTGYALPASNHDGTHGWKVKAWQNELRGSGSGTGCECTFVVDEDGNAVIQGGITD